MMVIENMVRLHIIIFIEIIMECLTTTEYEPNEGFHHCIIDTTNHYAMHQTVQTILKQMVFMHGILKVLDMDCTVNNGKCYILGL